MKDGQVGIVTKWGSDDMMEGEIVQRYKDGIIMIGKPSGECYDSILTVRELNGYEVTLITEITATHTKTITTNTKITL